MHPGPTVAIAIAKASRRGTTCFPPCLHNSTTPPTQLKYNPNIQREHMACTAREARPFVESCTLCPFLATISPSCSLSDYASVSVRLIEKKSKKAKKAKKKEKCHKERRMQKSRRKKKGDGVDSDNLVIQRKSPSRTASCSSIPILRSFFFFFFFIHLLQLHGQFSST